MIDTAVQRGDGWSEAVDWEALATKAVDAALRASPYGWMIDQPFTVEVSIKLTDDAEVRGLNAQYRGKDRPTNVLSFPMVQRDLLDAMSNSDDGEVLLGDIVLADGVCIREAAEKGVAPEIHATHLIVHGVLHLVGYDHLEDAEGDAMEAIERAALATLGIDDPYAIDDYGPDGDDTPGQQGA
jgi:probable rRNA maturation factor